ncbi:MAG: hypothetical protein KDC18_06410 [Alphaproteobacteria bacterium]|nr:hypothetical protein [Alphaproteobacteria bacterium]MCB9931628.1 hypothetical protein [Alphaproteobacteria bacterium]
MANLSTFVTKIENFLNNIAHLEITTAVGEFNLRYDPATGKWVPVESADGLNAIRTDINLFQGDLTTAIHNRFAGDAGNAIRAFHETQVGKAEGIVKGNIDAFKEMVILLAQARAENDGAHAAGDGQDGAGHEGAGGAGGAAGGGGSDS